MEFRQAGQRGERRRRVLIDEMAATPLAADGEAPCARTEAAAQSSVEQRNYADAALASHQARITDVIPTRRWTLTALLFTGLTIIAGLEAVYGRVVGNGPGRPDLGDWTVFDPAQPAQLGRLVFGDAAGRVCPCQPAHLLASTAQDRRLPGPLPNVVVGCSGARAGQR